MFSHEEGYLLGYMKGYRIGMIESARKILIRCLRIKAKEQGFEPAKSLFMKINREIDIKFIHELILNVYKDKLSVKELEMYYDMYFLVPDKKKKSKSLWRSPLLK